jgi:hypothetical protein
VELLRGEQFFPLFIAFHDVRGGMFNLDQNELFTASFGASGAINK